MPVTYDERTYCMPVMMRVVYASLMRGHIVRQL